MFSKTVPILNFSLKQSLDLNTTLEITKCFANVEIILKYFYFYNYMAGCLHSPFLRPETWTYACEILSDTIDFKKKFRK